MPTADLIQRIDDWAQSEHVELVQLSEEVSSRFAPFETFDEVVQAHANITDDPDAQATRTSTPHVRNWEGLDSIERMMDDSNLVVRGKITDCAFLQGTDFEVEGTFNQWSLQLEVSETLKGQAFDSIAFDVSDIVDPRPLRRAETELLVFLKDNQYRPSFGTRMRFTARDTASHSVIVLDGVNGGFAADLRWIDRPSDILTACRRVAMRDMPPPGLVFDVHLPPTLLAETPWREFQNLHLVIPIDSQLEQHAHRWVESADQEKRRIGVSALAYFKSDDNKRLLRGLLDDPGTWARAHVYLNGPDVPVRYLIRWEAWSILHAWEVDVPLPTLR